LNLSLPMIAFSEPGLAEKTIISKDLSFTLWDRWDVRGDMTLEQFVKHFKSKYNLTVTGVFQDTAMVYVPMFPGHKKRLPSPMSVLLKNPNGQKYIDLIVSFADDAGSDVNGPSVRYFFNN